MGGRERERERERKGAELHEFGGYGRVEKKGDVSPLLGVEAALY